MFEGDTRSVTLHRPPCPARVNGCETHHARARLRTGSGLLGSVLGQAEPAAGAEAPSPPRQDRQRKVAG
jgi:hypothetical protein